LATFGLPQVTKKAAEEDDKMLAGDWQALRRPPDPRRGAQKKPRETETAMEERILMKPPVLAAWIYIDIYMW
jgi:hypothetical protein